MSEHINMGFSDFPKDRDYKKFVNTTKAIVRRSSEYCEWVKFIKFTVGYNFCQITEESQDDLTVDLHHYPIALEHIVESVLNAKILRGRVTSLDIAKEVVKLHYDNHVGYVLLISSLHEKFHNGKLSIPLNMVHGDYTYILNNYPVPEEVRDLISKYKKIKNDDINVKWAKDNYPYNNDNKILGGL